MPEMLDLLAERVADEHPRVRLEAVAATGRIPQPALDRNRRAAREKPIDPSSISPSADDREQLKGVWMPEFQAGKLTFGGNQDHLNYVLRGRIAGGAGDDRHPARVRHGPVRAASSRCST